MRETLDAYFWKYVDKTSDCWVWTGPLTWNGYGTIRKGTAHARAHHYLVGGPAPKGYDWDHTCHNTDDACPGGVDCIHRRCVKPAHLELVTRAVNLSRGRHDYYAQGSFNRGKTHCPQGHAYTPENTVTKRTGWRECRICKNARDRERWATHIE